MVAVSVSFEPLGNTVLVELVEEVGLSIVLPDTSQLKREMSRTRVLSVGQGALLHSGAYAPILVKPGDFIEVAPTARASMVKVAGKELMVLDADAILGVYRE